MKYFILLTSLLFSYVALAQTIQKHPRVAELERFLAAEAFNYVKGRFPDTPILVEVNIDPLRRVESVSLSSDETIPFNTTKTVSAVDEWDDPKRNLHELFPRIRTASIKVILPNRVTDSEVIELRQTLFQTLKLVYGRDKIEFERRTWKQERSINWYDLAMIAIVLLMFLPVLFFSLRSAASKVSKGIAEVSSQMPNISGSSSGATPSAPPPAPVTPNASQATTNDIRFNDPIKIREKIRPVIDNLCEDKTFPDLNDMILFDDAIHEDAKQAGALLSTFPKHIQEKLFMLSSHSNWLVAFAEPGDLTISSYEFASRLQRKDRTGICAEWEELLILLWRLDEALGTFLQEIEQEEAMSILAAMPSKISIPFGKRALPGSWAALLDPDFKKERLSLSRIGDLTAKALEIQPYSDIAMLKKYQHEKGLIEYLKHATIRDEREVYEAARTNSTIHALRPPFYPVLDLEAKDLKSFITKVGMEQWALALFNVSRDERVNFEKAINEKQRYFFIENLKSLNGQNIDGHQIGNARERIALLHSKISLEQQVTAQLHTENQSEGGVHKKAA